MIQRCLLPWLYLFVLKGARGRRLFSLKGNDSPERYLHSYVTVAGLRAEDAGLRSYIPAIRGLEREHEALGDAA